MPTIHDNDAAGKRTRTQQPDYCESNSSGMVLVVVVILAAVAGILAAGLHFASGSRITQVRQEVRFGKAFFVAEAGIERAKAELRSNPTNLNTVFFGGVTNYGEGTFYVSARNNGGTNDVVIIRSTGIVETATRVIEVEVRVTPFTPGQVHADGSLGIYGTNTDLSVSGNGKIDGHDWNVPADFNGSGAALNGTLSTNAAVPGVLYTSTSTIITASSDGIDGNPPRTNGVGVNNETYWYQFLDKVMTVATTYTPSGSMGTRAAPVITMLPLGTTTITGNGNGAGILIIPGYANLRVTGTWHYEGLVILEGDGVIDADSEFTELGTARIFGAMICVGGALDITATGSADIKYSTQALANLVNLANLQPIPAQLDMIYWKEIKASSTNW